MRVCGWLSDDCPDKNDRRESARARSQLHKQALSPIMRIYALRILERALLRTCKLLQHIFAARKKPARRDAVRLNCVICTRATRFALIARHQKARCAIYMDIRSTRARAYQNCFHCAGHNLPIRCQVRAWRACGRRVPSGGEGSVHNCSLRFHCRRSTNTRLHARDTHLGCVCHLHLAFIS